MKFANEDISRVVSKAIREIIQSLPNNDNQVNEIRTPSLADSIDVKTLSDGQLKKLKIKIDDELVVRKQQNRINSVDKNLQPVDIDYVEALTNHKISASKLKRFKGGLFVDSRNPNIVYAKSANGTLYKFNKHQGWKKI